MSSESSSSPAAGAGRSPGRVPSASHRLLVVAEDATLQVSVRRELTPGFELLPASSLALALVLLDVKPSPAAVLVDLGHPESRKMADFLAALVDRAYPGPRILLSSHFRPEEAATLSQASVIHFALAMPWTAGQLRAFVEAALGFRPFPESVQPL